MTSNIIKFIHSGRIIEIRNPDPNETLLNYVRTKLRKTGTKEGCAEGGCGACTIVLGELKNNNINYKAINSCITFLPTLAKTTYSCRRFSFRKKFITSCSGSYG